ncbi:MAG: glycosyltransferase family 4 protein [Hyphomicrobiaceae bacterium]
MRILLAHTYYQRRGGEDAVFENEAKLLEDKGHTVIPHVAHNDSIESLRDKAAAFTQVTWNRSAACAMHAVIERERPDVMHVHNFFPLMSPSIYDAARRLGVPVVQTLHNYRLGCAAGFLTRDGEPCHDCVGRLPVAAVRHRCYRGSLPGSIAVAGMIAAHQLKGTWKTRVDRFIALTSFARGKLIEIGLPAERIIVKPNFAPDGGYDPDAVREGALFVGRLSPEKGVLGLVQNWQGFEAPLAVAGTGPLEAQLQAMVGARVRMLGQLSSEQLAVQYQRARCLVLPSTAYESMPMTLIEGWSKGLPPIAFRHSAFAELIEDGVTGLLVPPGDFGALMQRLQWAFDNPQAMAAMGKAARAHYEKHFTPEANCEALLAVYRAAQDSATAGAASRSTGKSWQKGL